MCSVLPHRAALASGLLLSVLLSVPVPPALAWRSARASDEEVASEPATAPETAGAPPPSAAKREPPSGRVYLNDRFGYALRRPEDWNFRFEPGMDVVISEKNDIAEIQVMARSFFDIRFQNIPEGIVTRGLRMAAKSSGEPFRQLRRGLSPALREYLQLFWLDSYVAWHTRATSEEYEEFQIESRRDLQLAGHGGVELVYTLQGKRRPGLQKIKTIIVAYDERICQLSYIASERAYEKNLEEFHEVVNSLYLHRDRG
jgi:hypothetical protein